MTEVDGLAGLRLLDLGSVDDLPRVRDLQMVPHVGLWADGLSAEGLAGFSNIGRLSMLLCTPEQFDTELRGSPLERMTVEVSDVDASAAMLLDRAERNPRAAALLHHTLLAGEGQSLRAAFALESFAYSVLMSGEEHRAWLSANRGHRSGDESALPSVRVSEGAHRDELSVVLSRPERRNAYGRRMRAELFDVVSLLDESPALKLEISAEGPVFCSGGDLSEFGESDSFIDAHLIRTAQNVAEIVSRHGERVSVVAHGACIGAGVEIPSLAGRFAVTADTVLRLPEVSMGLIPGAGGTVGAPRRIGRWRTAYLAVSGEAIDADTALRWGLVDEVL